MGSAVDHSTAYLVIGAEVTFHQGSRISTNSPQDRTPFFESSSVNNQRK